MVKKSARRTRRTHSPALKARIALATLREDKTLAELCSQFELHANLSTEWKRQLMARAADGRISIAAQSVGVTRNALEVARQLIWHAASLRDAGAPLSEESRHGQTVWAEKVCSAAIQTVE